MSEILFFFLQAAPQLSWAKRFSTASAKSCQIKDIAHLLRHHRGAQALSAHGKNAKSTHEQQVDSSLSMKNP